VKPHRKAFTLVELLVVITIIGILIALLLPAVQSAREAARRLQCSNHLKQIGLAVLLYEQHHGVYPMGRDATGDYALSWSFRLLPYLEQQAIFDAHDPTKATSAPENAASMRTTVSVFVCPTRRRPRSDGLFNDTGEKVGAVGDYAANVGTRFNEAKDPSATWVPDRRGPMYYQSVVTQALVRDGTSNTFAVGERSWIPDRDFAFFQSRTVTQHLRSTEAGMPIAPDDADYTKFGSDHSGGMAQFVFLDGHVAPIRYSIALDVLQSLSACASGNPISADAY